VDTEGEAVAVDR
jgi:ribosome-interacting GTPase 1